MFFRLTQYTHVALRWLLRVNEPVPERTDDEVSRFVERHYRWNFTVNLLDGASFWFGINMISATTIMPLFVSKLTDSAVALGLVAVIAQGSWFLPQLFTANVVERLARKKPVVVNLGFITERLPMLIMVGGALLAVQSPGLALWLVLIGYALHGLGAGVVATSWQDLIARCFPVDRRGRFFGTTMFVGAGMGVLAASLSTLILRRFAYPTNFIWLFSLATLGIMVSWVFLALTREPAQRTRAPRRNERQYWAELPQIVRRDHNFRHFLVARLLLALGGLATGFVTVTAVARWQVSDSTVGIYTAALLIGQTGGNLLFGFLADKFGHKLSLELSGLAAAAAFAIAWLAPSPGWYLVVFPLIGVATAAIIVSGILMVMEFCPPERRPTYVGLANTIVGLVSIAAPLLGSALLRAGHGWLFVLAVLINLAAFGAMRWSVREPRFVPVGGLGDQGSGIRDW